MLVDHCLCAVINLGDPAAFPVLLLACKVGKRRVRIRFSLWWMRLSTEHISNVATFRDFDPSNLCGVAKGLVVSGSDLLR